MERFEHRGRGVEDGAEDGTGMRERMKRQRDSGRMTEAGVKNGGAAWEHRPQTGCPRAFTGQEGRASGRSAGRWRRAPSGPAGAERLGHAQHEKAVAALEGEFFRGVHNGEYAGAARVGIHERDQGGEGFAREDVKVDVDLLAGGDGGEVGRAELLAGGGVALGCAGGVPAGPVETVEVVGDVGAVARGGVALVVVDHVCRRGERAGVIEGISGGRGRPCRGCRRGGGARGPYPKGRRPGLAACSSTWEVAT